MPCGVQSIPPDFMEKPTQLSKPARRSVNFGIFVRFDKSSPRETIRPCGKVMVRLPNLSKSLCFPFKIIFPEPHYRADLP